MGLAERFIRNGNRVIVCGRREDRLRRIEKELPGIVTRVCDVGVDAQREELAAWVLKSHPDTNVLVNNAGIQLAARFNPSIDMAKIHAEVEINLVAPLHLFSLFSHHLSTKKSSAIVNVSSGLAFAPISFMPVYCATKAALHSLTLSLRHQLKGTSVKVFEIIPPSVDTELGKERRTNPAETHGGMPIAEFVDEVMKALGADKLEAAIGQAIGLREKGEALFDGMNR